MYTIYGIKNCDTVKKALGQLNDQGTEYEFVDLKQCKLNKNILQSWKQELGEWPINTRGTTFRALKAEWEQASENQKFSLITDNPSLIKRPVLVKNGKLLLIGFKTEEYANLT